MSEHASCVQESPDWDAMICMAQGGLSIMIRAPAGGVIVAGAGSKLCPKRHRPSTRTLLQS